MPKIIENPREMIIERAQELIKRIGYDQTTVRNIVKECGISVGTMYNYFPSKEALVKGFLMDDWNETIKRINDECTGNKDIWKVFECIYNEVGSFAERYGHIFNSNSAQYEVQGQYEKRHQALRKQLAEIIDVCCREQAVSYTEYMPQFICDILLRFSIEKADFSKIKGVMSPLFRE